MAKRMAERPPQYRTLAEVASLLRLSIPSIRRLVAAGELPATYVGAGARKLVVAERDIATYMEKRRYVPEGARR